MTILLGIIALHLGLIFSARKFKQLDIRAIFLIVIFSIAITAWLLFGMYTMEKPDTSYQFV